MKIDVYDSYTTNRNGDLMHFDVLVETGTSSEKAWQYGKQWLESIGENADALEQSRCNFCHSESANPQVHAIIEQNEFCILKMEGCPR